MTYGTSSFFLVVLWSLCYVLINAYIFAVS
jgi:hypothetical protein